MKTKMTGRMYVRMPDEMRRDVETAAALNLMDPSTYVRHAILLKLRADAHGNGHTHPQEDRHDENGHADDN
jgi:hypothetical protein